MPSCRSIQAIAGTSFCTEIEPAVAMEGTPVHVPILGLVKSMEIDHILALQEVGGARTIGLA